MGIKNMYQKEIIYLNLYDNDVKEGCVGYLKSEERQGKFRLELQTKNIPEALSGNCPISLQDTTGWHDAGILMLKEGNGRWTGSAGEPVLRVEIDLPDSDKIKGQSRNAPKQEKRERKHSGLPESEGIETGWRDMSEAARTELGWQDMSEAGETESGRRVMPESEGIESGRQVMPESEGAESGRQVMTAHAAREPEQLTIAEASGNMEGQRSIAESSESKIKRQGITESSERRQEPQPVVEAVEMQQNRKAFTGIGSSRRIQPKPVVKAENTPLYESKWEQLLATYEQIHPYGDSRVYVKLEPKDFVVLPSGYQHLVNNSFLLHGFYNYRYLILGREKDFYLGVPGVFYEREKMVALMFGFEAFECEGGNAEEGKFGYYLRKVEL